MLTEVGSIYINQNLHCLQNRNMIITYVNEAWNVIFLKHRNEERERVPIFKEPEQKFLFFKLLTKNESMKRMLFLIIIFSRINYSIWVQLTTQSEKVVNIKISRLFLV